MIGSQRTSLATRSATFSIPARSRSIVGSLGPLGCCDLTMSMTFFELLTRHGGHSLLSSSSKLLGVLGVDAQDLGQQLGLDATVAADAGDAEARRGACGRGRGGGGSRRSRPCGERCRGRPWCRRRRGRRAARRTPRRAGARRACARSRGAGRCAAWPRWTSGRRDRGRASPSSASRPRSRSTSGSRAGSRRGCPARARRAARRGAGTSPRRSAWART